MDDRQLIVDLLSALEYHTEQTRPIEFSKVAIEAAREYLRKPAQQMNPEIKKMYEDYFDKFFRESSSAVPENFMDALRFDVAVRDSREWEKVDMREHAEGNLGIGTAPPPQQRTWVGLKPEQVQFYAALHRQLEVVYYDATLDTNVITETFNATDFYQQVESCLKELNK